MAANIAAEVKPGDPTEAGEPRKFATITAGTVEVAVYESLITPGLIIVDIDAPDDGRTVAVTVNDGYVFDGSGTKERPKSELTTWTFCGYWGDDGHLVVEYSLDGEVADTREDKGRHESGLWASSASGRTEDEARAYALAEYQEELLAEVVEGALGDKSAMALDEDTWFDQLRELGWTDEQIADSLEGSG